MILLKFREQQNWLTKSISRAFQTLKFTGVLALRAMFKISVGPRAPLTRGDVMVSVLAIFNGFRVEYHEIIELNVACRDGFP